MFCDIKCDCDDYLLLLYNLHDCPCILLELCTIDFEYKIKLIVGRGYYCMRVLTPHIVLSQRIQCVNCLCETIYYYYYYHLIFGSH